MSTHQPAIRIVNATAYKPFKIAIWISKNALGNKLLADQIERLLVAIVLPVPLAFVNPYLYLAIVTGCYIERR